MSNPTVHDIAAYILARFDRPISTMKLQKLVYLAQGWHLGMLNTPLFDEDFEAWARGPVSRDLFRHHRTEYSVSAWEHGSPSELSERQRIVVDAVVKNYGGLSGVELSELTHLQGTPWSDTRAEQRVSDGAVSTATIKKDAIQRHFATLLGADVAVPTTKAERN